ncbi:peptide-binding protein [Burkholderia glumae]|uniref:peptide-binding protein n=2 Tax=Burkholderia glumae TaxID=337 RepID=UPI000F5EAAE7|nr:peptide-binding protein [Burkholderia glumae]MCQ0031655.1 peptide-binding protein [Burkholderia glumae]MCQ0039273.1 peptide-binding protein [Burkholderia glumae]QJW79252.1 peptide-binding protein [Burkholderia glumae]RQZ76227.1 peptide-binding protein [Burkholderia glumae]UVS85755.1 peptide-binding protein [Burkholderia glumae]
MRVDRAKRTIGKWLTAAAMALAASLAFAHPPHGGGGRGGGAGAMHRDLAPGWRSEAGGVRWGLRPSRAAAAPYRVGAAGGPAEGGDDGRYPGASPYRSVSASSSSLPRPPGAADGAIRSGSIRADVTRYNEERGRPPAPRAQESADSRGTFFSSFYRNN